MSRRVLLFDGADAGAGGVVVVESSFGIEIGWAAGAGERVT